MKLIDQYEDIELVDALEERYLAYALTTIMDRALPDSRDGLKPVHRRLLYAMYQLNLKPTSSFKKSARVVGDVMGRFHPHGDQAIYDTLVRLAQDFSVRWPLIDGQGNFGNIDGDNAAAMRYTEARLTAVSELLLEGIEEEAVEFRSTYDEVDKEPIVLPSNFPNLLANGSSGIAVGMATSIPPHNVEELCNASLYLIKHRNASYEKLFQIVKAPDFPTGGIIYGYEGVKQAFETGRGRIVMRAKAEIEEVNGRECIIVTEIPYQVNKAEMIRKTAEMVNDKKIEGISTIRDESDRQGMRIVYVLKRDSVPNVVLNTLFKHTQLQSSFSVNNIALVKGRPQMLNLKQMIGYFVEHRHDVVVRRTKYELNKIDERLEALKGFLIAYLNMDEVISIIREEDNPKKELIARFELSEFQAESILNMRLRSLRKLEEIKIKNEFKNLNNKKNNLEFLLNSNDEQWGYIAEEIKILKKKYAKNKKSPEKISGFKLVERDYLQK